jgi:hypothetical protein
MGRFGPYNAVGPELVEGLPFYGPDDQEEGQGFDKLSLNGSFVERGSDDG